MPAQDIGANKFYNLMTDPNKGSRDKHDELVAIFNKAASKAEIAALQQDYAAFQQFMRGKSAAIETGLRDAKNREFQMEQALGAATPDASDILSTAVKQAEQLERLAKGNAQQEEILSTMFSAEGVAKPFNGVASTDTSGVYFEVQAQGKSIERLQESLGNTKDELAKLARGEPLSPPAPPAAQPDLAPVPVAVFEPAQFGLLEEAVEAPHRAVFKKQRVTP